MDRRLREILKKIKDRKLQRMTAELIENPAIEIGGKTYTGLQLIAAPAGLSHHHSYRSGFIDHIVGCAEVATVLCDVAEKVYGGMVNRDFVIAGVLLHDLFKPLVYEAAEATTPMQSRPFVSSVLGEYFDHLTLIVAELIRRGFPFEVAHIVCAHHGYQAGPIGPRSVEALIVHLADIADSQLNGEVLRAARFLIRSATGEEWADLTSKEAFEIVNAKTVGGWDKAKKTIREMKNKRHAKRD